MQERKLRNEVNNNVLHIILSQISFLMALYVIIIANKSLHRAGKPVGEVHRCI